jgi:hypothetical protein
MRVLVRSLSTHVYKRACPSSFRPDLMHSLEDKNSSRIRAFLDHLRLRKHHASLRRGIVQHKSPR